MFLPLALSYLFDIVLNIQVLCLLRRLCILHAFENQITVIPPEVIEKMTNLTFLNLNHNQIGELSNHFLDIKCK